MHKKTGKGSYLSFLHRRTENKGITYKKQQADNKKKNLLHCKQVSTSYYWSECLL